MEPITDISQLDLSKSYTYADYLSWKFTDLVELVRGRVTVKATPFTAHQQCLGNLVGTIGMFCKRKPYRAYMRPLDVRLGSERDDARIKTVVQPDLLVVFDKSKIDERGCLGAPDWIVEVISPQTAVYDLRTKFDLYAENGVTEYWVVFPGEQSIITFVLHGDDYQATGTYDEPGLIPSHTLPELQLEWSDVFEGVASIAR
jgi:Uma2 family endonuclease